MSTFVPMCHVWRRLNISMGYRQWVMGYAGENCVELKRRRLCRRENDCWSWSELTAVLSEMRNRFWLGLGEKCGLTAAFSMVHVGLGMRLEWGNIILCSWLESQVFKKKSTGEFFFLEDLQRWYVTLSVICIHF